MSHSAAISPVTLCKPSSFSSNISREGLVCLTSTRHTTRPFSFIRSEQKQSLQSEADAETEQKDVPRHRRGAQTGQHGLPTEEGWKWGLHTAWQPTYLLKRLSMMAFSVHRSSAGKELACQRRRSSALERYSVLAMSVRN